jgi:hypothetical protein
VGETWVEEVRSLVVKVVVVHRRGACISQELLQMGAWKLIGVRLSRLCYVPL